MGERLIVFNKKKKASSEALIKAQTDAEAIASFLREYKNSPGTLQSYTKEIERLLLWCIHIGKINISSISREDLIAYQSFLKSPNPKKQWCGASVAKTTKDGQPNKNWQPSIHLSNTSRISLQKPLYMSTQLLEH